MAGEEAGLSGLAGRYASALFELADDVLIKHRICSQN